ncbi:hypothetical protein OG871_36325 [Kitasatospora sp. NBC_00374]|uniref:hypothetical protein n=1 Tax=Kitasatospora sp. NBC_00374 TaxID=2975964 RepID=UPI0030DEBD66
MANGTPNSTTNGSAYDAADGSAGGSAGGSAIGMAEAVARVLAEHGTPQEGVPAEADQEGVRSRLVHAGGLQVTTEVDLASMDAYEFCSFAMPAGLAQVFLRFEELPERWLKAAAEEESRDGIDVPHCAWAVTMVAVVAAGASAQDVLDADYGEVGFDATWLGEWHSALADSGRSQIGQLEQPGVALQDIAAARAREAARRLYALEQAGDPTPFLQLTDPDSGPGTFVFPTYAMSCNSILEGTGADGRTVCHLWSDFEV